MSEPFIDTDVIIRLLTNDDPGKQKRAAKLFEQVETRKLTFFAPDTVIADAVYVLSSKQLYKKSREEVWELLVPLVRLPKFKVKNRRIVLLALAFYATTKLDFGDAMIVAAMEQVDSKVVYSYDTDFDKITRISRRTP